eukprot:CAMPEP_0172545866 /NCGR_PEP_ID=MMETSP1067-20121228/15721_1 /TAXON_ID=265564 ORGANISM="Thalassiosira punctigera, Strain Tpunct2005C2" /NCGR_SAMPLE_ID=MMETSP1067 /ASSEMBLY_ACC=CAM_ASM_000444 /LENGTH=238 /DNA_ID=CAMNT_0013332697 /DNA_START=40 /DNA_END=756 /DNA_ORIENTATION=+
MAKAKTSCLLWLAIFLASATAFTGQTGSVSARHSAPSMSPCQHRDRLHAAPSRADDDLPKSIPDNNGAVTKPSKYDEGDPRRALEEFGSLFSLLQTILLEGSTWDGDTLEAKTKELIGTYLRVFVPGVGYAATSLAVFGSTFSFLALTLAVSGHGYADVLSAVNDVEPLRNLVEGADPAWGNAAIALIGCEILSPVMLAATLALTPKTMDALRTKLDELGWGEGNIDERAADILRVTG